MTGTVYYLMFVIGFVTVLVSTAVWLTCFVLVLRRLWNGGEKRSAVLSGITFPVGGLGLLLAFLAGVRKANHLRLETALCVWSVAFVLSLLGGCASLYARLQLWHAESEIRRTIAWNLSHAGDTFLLTDCPFSEVFSHPPARPAPTLANLLSWPCSQPTTDFGVFCRLVGAWDSRVIGESNRSTVISYLPSPPDTSSSQSDGPKPWISEGPKPMVSNKTEVPVRKSAMAVTMRLDKYGHAHCEGRDGTWTVDNGKVCLWFRKSLPETYPFTPALLPYYDTMQSFGRYATNFSGQYSVEALERDILRLHDASGRTIEVHRTTDDVPEPVEGG